MKRNESAFLCIKHTFSEQKCDIGGREKFIIKVMRGPRHYDPEK
jgi:hypothetical protein